jgi:hypothetical protein
MTGSLPSPAKCPKCGQVMQEGVLTATSSRLKFYPGSRANLGRGKTLKRGFVQAKMSAALCEGCSLGVFSY